MYCWALWTSLNVQRFQMTVPRPLALSPMSTVVLSGRADRSDDGQDCCQVQGETVDPIPPRTGGPSSRASLGALPSTRLSYYLYSDTFLADQSRRLRYRTYPFHQSHLRVYCGETVADLLEAIEATVSKTAADSIRRHLLDGPRQGTQAFLGTKILLLCGGGVGGHQARDGFHLVGVNIGLRLGRMLDPPYN